MNKNFSLNLNFSNSDSFESIANKLFGNVFKTPVNKVEFIALTGDEGVDVVMHFKEDTGVLYCFVTKRVSESPSFKSIFILELIIYVYSNRYMDFKDIAHDMYIIKILSKYAQDMLDDVKCMQYKPQYYYNKQRTLQRYKDKFEQLT